MHGSLSATLYARHRMRRFDLSDCDVNYILNECAIDHASLDADSFVEHQADLPDGSSVIVRAGNSAITDVIRYKGGKWDSR